MIYVETSYYGVSFLCQYIPYILVVPVHRRGCQSISWWCLCIAEGARALLRSALRHPRLQKIASSRRGTHCYVHFNEKQKETHLTSLFVFSSYSFYLAFLCVDSCVCRILFDKLTTWCDIISHQH